MKKCPYCGNMCDDKNKHCTVCGTSLVPKIEEKDGLFYNNAFSIIIYILLSATLLLSLYLFVATLVPLFMAHAKHFGAFLLVVFYALVLLIFNIIALVRYHKRIRDYGYIDVITFIILGLSNIFALALALLDKEHRM